MGQRRRVTASSPLIAITAVALVLGVVAALVARVVDGGPPLRSFRAQACGLPDEWLARTKSGYFPGHSGQIAVIPNTPAYMASGAGGWSHSGPWPYLQDVPLVFYGPGRIAPRGDIDRPVTMADVAPTFATMLKGSFQTDDGRSLNEVAQLDADLLERGAPKLILTIVWDGGGWNVLNRWREEWPNLARLMQEGVSYTNATVGSSPSVTPAVHTTLGTGVFPWTHGITGIPIRDQNGEVQDAFYDGESSRFLQVAAIAERWDEQNDNRALIGMVGYEPWHLGMIGMGAEKPGGDRDDAVWLHTKTNEWITNRDHYKLPRAISSTEGLEDDVATLDAADGETDGAWGEHDILDDPERLEETPAFIRYHARALKNLIRGKGYGDDAIADLVFTNFKQIDRVGHYFNMASQEVRDSLIASDEVLGEIVDFLDAEVGRGDYVVVVTADHGQQPDADVLDAYGIDPKEMKADIDAEFGAVTRAVWPTEIFLHEDAMEREGVTVAEVARFLGRYTLADNTKRPDIAVAGAGRFDPGDRLFDMAIPSAMLPTLACESDNP